MAKRVQRRRGTTAEHSTFTGAVGEITVDTTKEVVVVHDGATAGGFPSAREDLQNVTLTNLIGISELNVSDGTNGQVLSTNGSGTLSFDTIDATTAVIGGDLSGTVANAQIIADAVGTTELAADAVTTVKITDANVTDAKLATDSVTTIKILDDNVTTAKIADSAITSAKILNGAIVADDLAINSVTTDKILDANVSSAKLSNDAVINAKIANNAVTTAKINTDAVTATEIAANAVGSSEIAATAVTDAKLNTTGTMPAWDGSALTDMPYDVAFTAGFDKDMVKENVAVATYGELVMARAGTFVGEAGYADTATSGTTIVTIQKNGTNIYSSSPQFVSSSSMSAGTLSVTTFAVNDRLTFKVTAIGATPGQGIRFTLKCKV
jgi:hypothetical protein